MELRRSSTNGHTLTSYDIRDLPKDPNIILRWSWENVQVLAQLAAMGWALWKCGKRELYIAAELCRTHPDLAGVARALRLAHDGVRVTQPGKEEP
jgi:hypothetical protein